MDRENPLACHLNRRKHAHNTESIVESAALNWLELLGQHSGQARCPGVHHGAPGAGEDTLLVAHPTTSTKVAKIMVRLKTFTALSVFLRQLKRPAVQRRYYHLPLRAFIHERPFIHVFLKPPHFLNNSHEAHPEGS